VRRWTRPPLLLSNFSPRRGRRNPPRAANPSASDADGGPRGRRRRGPAPGAAPHRHGRAPRRRRLRRSRQQDVHRAARAAHYPLPGISSFF
jgi:hypothetical protein